MDVEFIADNPRRKARPILDGLLRNGVDQLAIACAFCTGAGIELLVPHARRLSNPGSFVVVAAAPPTDYVGLSRLDRIIPGNLFVHWGALAPSEKKIGAPLMHSKVFFARFNRECWLWTGSHNLTGNATQGGNCEAAVLLHGDVDEQPFVDALVHLNACRSAATRYDPNADPPGTTQRADILVIHAEADSLPTLSFPWRVHLCLESDDFDKQLAAPADTRLFLYPKGSLNRGWQNATPFAAFSGALTGLNLTDKNRNVRGAGTIAEWNSSNLSISEERGVLVLGPSQVPGALVTTQAVFCIDAASPKDELLFSEEPRIQPRLIPGEQTFMQVDPDMRRFYQPRDVVGSRLLDVPAVGRKHVLQVGEKDARNSDLDQIRDRVASMRPMEIEFATISAEKATSRHPFIVRTKFRLPKLP